MLFPEVRIFILEMNLFIWQIEYVRRNYPYIKLHVCRDEQMLKGEHLRLAIAQAVDQLLREALH